MAKKNASAKKGFPKKIAVSRKKSASKKKTAVAKKAASRTAISRKKAAARKKVAGRQRGPSAASYTRSSEGLLVPGGSAEPVPPSKLRDGIKAAKRQLSGIVRDLSEIEEGFDVSEIELAISFSADGKFLGIGVGGATAIAIRIRPSR